MKKIFTILVVMVSLISCKKEIVQESVMANSIDALTPYTPSVYVSLLVGTHPYDGVTVHLYPSTDISSDSGCICVNDWDAYKLGNFTENIGILVSPATLSVESRNIHNSDTTYLKIWNMLNIDYRIAISSSNIGKDTTFWLCDKFGGNKKILPNTFDTLPLHITPETNVSDRLKIYYSIKKK